jgi:hypothetical protein
VDVIDKFDREQVLADELKGYRERHPGAFKKSEAQSPTPPAAATKGE